MGQDLGAFALVDPYLDLLDKPPLARVILARRNGLRTSEVNISQLCFTCILDPTM